MTFSCKANCHSYLHLIIFYSFQCHCFSKKITGMIYWVFFCFWVSNNSNLSVSELIEVLNFFDFNESSFIYVCWKVWRFSYFVFDSSKYDKKKLDQNPSVKDVVKWVYGPMIEELLQVSYKPLVRRWCSKRSMQLFLFFF